MKRTKEKKKSKEDERREEGRRGRVREMLAKEDSTLYLRLLEALGDFLFLLPFCSWLLRSCGNKIKHNVFK